MNFFLGLISVEFPMSFALGDCTSNVAEYMGLIMGLRVARKLKITTLNIYGDSQLVIRQSSGSYATRDAKLKILQLLVEEKQES